MQSSQTIIVINAEKKLHAPDIWDYTDLDLLVDETAANDRSEFLHEECRDFRQMVTTGFDELKQPNDLFVRLLR